MPQKVPFPIVLPYNKTKQIGINPERTINLYAVNMGDEQASSALIGCAGLKRSVVFPNGNAVRRVYVFEKNMYVVVDQYVYIMDNLLTPLLIGTIGTTQGYVGIAANNAHQVMFVDGTGGWVFNDTTGVFTQITDPGFPNPAPSTIVFFNSFFVINSISTNLWAISNPNNGLVYDATQTQTFQSQPDTIVAINVINASIFIFGTKNTEIWFGQQGAFFPFSRDSTIRLQFGAAAVGTVIQAEGMLFFLSQSASGKSSVMMTNGGIPQSITPADLEQEFDSYSVVSDAHAYLYRMNGHLFYAIYFPTAGTSFLYDVTTNFWVEQQMQNGSIYIVSDAASFNSEIYAGSSKSGLLYLMEQDELQNDGEPITRTRITHPFVAPSLQAIRLNSLEIDMVQGQGKLNPPDVKPFIELQVSYDRGITWRKQRTAPISKLGYTAGYRSVFRNLGVNKDFTFKIIIYNSINVTIRSAAINYDIVGN